MSLIKEKEEQTKVIINCGVDLKNEFKDICKKNNLKMTDVLSATGGTSTDASRHRDLATSFKASWLHNRDVRQVGPGCPRLGK